jgi:putative tryptophan/tyrosine transport system substrate-binding protein
MDRDRLANKSLEGEMRRREFIGGLAGAAAWSAVARAQQRERTLRIGVLMSTAVDDPQDPARLAAFAQGLQELGWTVGRNLRIDYRWSASSLDNARKYTTELAAMAPDVMLASGTIALAAVQQISHTIPAVFVNLVDPVSGGFVESLARPGGTTTGFLLFEFGISGKWLVLLKEIAPRVTQVAVLRDSTQGSGMGQLGAIQSAASQFGVEFRLIDVRDAGVIERGITDFARGLNGGLIVTAGTLAREHRELIVGLAARNRLPTVYFNRLFVEAGGLISYGADTIDPFRRAANYVDRILKGEKPADLPVQAPVKYETVINLKTAKALGLTIPETLLATADEVIQ